MDQLLAYEGASTSMDAQLQKFAATADLAEVFRAEAEEARREKLALLDEAEAAKDAGRRRGRGGPGRSPTRSPRARPSWSPSSPELQGISVSSPSSGRRRSRRSSGSAGRGGRRGRGAGRSGSRGRRPEAAAPQAPAEAAPEPEPSARAAAGPAPSRRPRPQPDARAGRRHRRRPSAPAPAPSGGAASAIAFARAQLGEPYVWGAAGPDSWDCSGLTMGAWRAGGASLPHYSVAQYDAATPISAEPAAPGGPGVLGLEQQPGSIHHVALYLGDGMIIHAPRTGRPVTIESMYYWIPPNFFGRV